MGEGRGEGFKIPFSPITNPEPPRMNPRLRMIGLLLAVVVFLDGVACLLDMTYPYYAEIFYLSLFFAQINLLSLWVGLGRAYWLIRVIALFGGIIALTCIHVAVDGTRNWDLTATIFAVQAAVVLPLAALARLSGFRWTVVATQPPGDRSAPAHHFQFTLKRLLGWTTVAAVVAALARQASFPSYQSNTLILVVTCTTIMTFASAWAVSATGRVIPRLLTVILVAGLLTALDGLVYNMYRSPSFIPAIIFLHALFIASWIDACQAVGIRIIRTEADGKAL